MLFKAVIAPIIQIATWNDYGEGTVIEPTKTFGYRYLEHIQKNAADDFPYGPDALRLPGILYQLKKRHERHPARMKELERATDLLFVGKYNEGRNVIEAVVEEQLNASDVNRDGTVNILDLLSCHTAARAERACRLTGRCHRGWGRQYSRSR